MLLQPNTDVSLMTGSESAEVAAIVASGDSAGLPANDVKSNEERHSQGDTKKPQEKMREAAEVYLLMHRSVCPTILPKFGSMRCFFFNENFENTPQSERS